MHLYFEKNSSAKCDCNILSLSWMGKLPDELQEDESWKLYRRKYYQEGWLATGNARSLVGVTFTTSHSRSRAPELPLRANYNLRGHRSEVILVKWNEPYQKLASCDSTGVIFVWIKYDGRWSIELINDRNTPVTHFSWSHDGRMALICYKDGFVLVGSVAGQRYWSSMLNHKAVITCGIWTPDDQQVYFGTTAGQLIVMDVHGAMVSEVQLGAGVTSMAWSAEKFKLEEDDDEDTVGANGGGGAEEYDRDDEDDDEDDSNSRGNVNNNNNNSNSSGGGRATSCRQYVLAVCLADGNVVLLRSFDDVSPVTINTGLRPPLHAEWSNSRKVLAIAGIEANGQQSQPQSPTSQQSHYYHHHNHHHHHHHHHHHQHHQNNNYYCNNNNSNGNGYGTGGYCCQTGNLEYTNLLKFYSDTGALIYTIVIPYTQSPVTAMTWGHNDRRIFVATGAQVHAAWVSRGVGSLQLLSRLALKNALEKETSVAQLPLPPRLKNLVAGLFVNTIRCCVPEPRELRRFVSRPPPIGGRLHCTMLRNPGEPPHSYTLYVEYLGGLVPLLKGRRTSKIRPEFVIFDPETGQQQLQQPQNGESTTTTNGGVGGAGAAQTTTTTATTLQSDCRMAAASMMLPSCSDDSDDSTVELCGGSPRFRRRNRRRCRTSYERSANNDDDEASYVDTLPENARLVEVTSNIWGTKFKFHGLADSVPANLGRVTYRPSLLHLQPRQMTLVITELRDDLPAGPDPSFNPNLFSEDEEDVFSQQEPTATSASRQYNLSSIPHCAALDLLSPQQQQPPPPMIAPMTPLSKRRGSGSLSVRPRIPATAAASTSLPPPPQYESRPELSINNDEEPWLERGGSCVEYLGNHRHLGYGPPTAEHHPSGYSGVIPPGYQHYHPHHHRSATYMAASRCCDVPALQSPKNAVAPTQTLIATSSPGATIGEYTNNVQRMKTALADQQSAISGLLKKDLDQIGGATGRHSNFLGEDCCSSFPGTVPSSYGYANGLGEQYNGPGFTANGAGVLLPKNANLTTRHNQEASATTRTGPANAGHSSLMEEEEQRNDVPALKNQFQFQASHRTPTVVSIGPTQVLANSIVRSCSVGYLDLVDAQIVPCEEAINMLRKDAPNKRLFLVSRKQKRRRRCGKENHAPVAKDGSATTSAVVVHRSTRPRLSDSGKSRSLDSSELFPSAEHIIALQPRLAELPAEEALAVATVPNTVATNALDHYKDNNDADDDDDDDDDDEDGTEIEQNEANVRKEEADAAAVAAVDASRRSSRGGICREQLPIIERIAKPSSLSPIQGSSVSTSVASSLDGLASRLDGLAAKLGDYEDCHSLPPPSPRPTSRLPRSSPSSPAPTKKGKRPASASPIRRRLLSSPLLGRKSRKNRNESSDEEGFVDDISNYRDLESFQKAQLRQKLKQRGGSYPSEAMRREIIMHNKAPMWNEANQVYQLDFGGRVTQESAKNFQIEFRGNQVMQFGRIQGNAYTLDFQYPFSAIQAFAVALASVTQRLK
ncbi:tubby-related protein 4 isoform X2 [Copidosoma floridanum]|uniref:tubby-related protein 4 isoform X2 n=1 Tax=Copidosoma floridanum TaxID=29053 RepID=UPI0006C94ACE|nr:tubby-related protein 4 isoform X2 [Copidosoma floridanum]